MCDYTYIEDFTLDKMRNFLSLSICLGTVYLIEIENFLLKVL